LKTKLKDDSGFTLVELIVALAIMALLMVGVIGLMSMNSASNKRLKADISVQSAAEDLSQSITDSVMQAQVVEIWSGGEKYTKDGEVGAKKFSEFSGTKPLTKMNVTYAVNYNGSFGTEDPALIDKDLCTITYEYDSTDEKVYVYRKFKYMTSLNDTYTEATKSRYLYASYVTDMQVAVDAESNSLEVLFNLNQLNRVYNSDDVIKIRNSYVLKNKK
jgi:prepilin-type N-terminal cleavage/methylation domain-containing protein